MRSRIVIGIVVDFFELDDLLLIVDSYTSNLDRFALVKLNHLSRARQVEEELIINNWFSKYIQKAFLIFQSSFHLSEFLPGLFVQVELHLLLFTDLIKFLKSFLL